MLSVKNFPQAEIRLIMRMIRLISRLLDSCVMSLIGLNDIVGYLTAQKRISILGLSI